MHEKTATVFIIKPIINRTVHKPTVSSIPQPSSLVRITEVHKSMHVFMLRVSTNNPYELNDNKE